MSVINRAYNRLRVDIREKLNPYFSEKRRRKLHDSNFTIISNNCWGGHVYRFFGIPYNTPTIGLFFFAQDYIKFVYNLRTYLNEELSFIPHSQSKYHEILLKYGGECVSCPIGKLGDIEVIFMHYTTPEEAKEKWERWKKRINWNNLIFKMSEQNGCTFEDLKLFNQFSAEKKCLFVSRDYGLKCQVIYKEYEDKGLVENDTNNFRKYINLYDLINGNSCNDNKTINNE